ncbi:hypothetical protein [Rhodovulum sp. YEN HP10]|uniref:hypothetical protein n=1 Tax=Rhodovulum sp. HP10 TaxID=3387397 RepID=UPI0039E0FEF2
MMCFGTRNRVVWQRPENGSSPPAPPQGARNIDEISAPCPNPTENIIVIGSEVSYDSFWWKMMFITPGLSNAQGSRRPPKWRDADRTTVFYVPNGYVHAELLPLEHLRDVLGINLVPLTSLRVLRKHLQNRTIDGKRHDVMNLSFYCHGLVGCFDLNYSGATRIRLGQSDLPSIDRSIFCSGGRIYSYACRTGVSVDKDAFSSLSEARPKESLAQALADHFGVQVHAFYTRTLFRDCIRDPSQAADIAEDLKGKRETQDGAVIDILDTHEGLPHPGQGLSTRLMGVISIPSWIRESGQVEEGTSEYSLWRKQGARFLPVGTDDPTGLPTVMAIFEPA